MRAKRTNAGLSMLLGLWLAAAAVSWSASQARAENDGSAAAPVKASEYQVKAAFLFNFAKFVEWPPDKLTNPNGPLVIGVIGEDPFGAALESIIQSKASINNHPLVLQRFASGSNPAACHILFVSRSEERKLAETLKELKGAPILTVSETDRFLENGGIINFYIESDNVKFAINEKAAQRAKLILSSKLLSVAKIVKVEGN